MNGSSRVFAFHGSHLMPEGTFSATLTTRAFDPSRLRWFATCSCKPIARGHTLISYAACCGTLMSFAQGGAIEELGGATHDLKFNLATRELQAGSRVGFMDRDGSRRSVTLEPLCRAYLRAGTGYGGPDAWRHGMYSGYRLGQFAGIRPD